MGNRLTARDREAYTAYAFGLISGAFDIIGAEDEGFDVNKPVVTVGQTAELVGIHPQTLRQYDRLALIVPQRTAGGARRYSLRDINKLVLTQHLVIEESINLSGVSRILRLMEENRQLRRQIRYLKKAKDLRMFAAGANGNVTEVFGDDSPESLEKVRSQIVDRDAADSTVSEFTNPGPGIELIDTSDLDIEGVLEAVISLLPAGMSGQHN